MSDAPRVPKAMQEKFAAITRLTDDFCNKHLDEDYRKIITEAVAALSRKRPSPLVRGKENVWAAAVVHAIGATNFLFDSSQLPHCRAPEIYTFFGTAASTSQSKSREIRNMLDMSAFNFKWQLPALLARNPAVWMVQVNGMIFDIRELPAEIQQQAWEQGIIPFLPESSDG